MNGISKSVLTLFLTIVVYNSASAQINQGPLTNNERKVVLDTVEKLVNDRYIDENLATKIAAYLAENSKKRNI